MKDRIIKNIDDNYLVFFPSNGYFKICSNEIEAKNVINYNRTLKKINRKQAPSMYTIHITNRCNLRCKYCFSKSESENNIDMNKSTIELIIKKIVSSPIKKLCIDFHGGEPLLRFDLIKYTLLLCEKYLFDREITYTIQTNATLINEEVCKLFKQKKFNVGISLDGPASIHNQNRIYPTGNGSFNQVLKKIKLLKKNGIPFSIISVVTKTEEMYQMYDFFVKNDIRKVKFMPVMPQGRAKKEIIDLNKYADIESELLLKEIHSNNPILLMSSYIMLRKMICVDNSYMCMRNPCGAGINIISFDEYGNIFPCDSMSGIDNIDKLSFGNVCNKELNISQTPTWKEITNIKISSITPCNTCQYRNICCGGCKSDVLNFYGNFYHPSPLCLYYKKILDNYYTMITRYSKKIIDYMQLFSQ